MANLEETISKCNESVPIRDRNEKLLFVEEDEKPRGYRVDFLREELPSSFKGFVICTVCEGLMRDACGVGDPQVFMCAVCANGEAIIALHPNRDVIQRMAVFCPLNTRGCSWEGVVSAVDTHLNECEYLFIDCELSCGIVLKRQDMVKHLINSCPFREIICEYCSEYHKEQDTNLHLVACTKLPLTCSNGCGNSAERMHMEAHMEMCPNTLLDCEYKKYGCEVTFLRKDIGRHNKDDKHVHMELMMQSGIQNLTKEFDKVKQDNQTIKEQLITLREENSAQKNSLSKLTEEFLSMKSELNVLKDESKQEKIKMKEEQNKLFDDTIKPLVERVEFIHAKQTLLYTELAEKASCDKVESLTTNCMNLQYLTAFRQKRLCKMTQVSEKGLKCLSENWEDMKVSTVKIIMVSYQLIDIADNEQIIRFTGRFSVKENSKTTVNLCIVLLNNTCDVIHKLYKASVVMTQDAGTRKGSIRNQPKYRKADNEKIADIPWVEIKKEGICVDDCVFILVYFDKDE